MIRKEINLPTVASFFSKVKSAIATDKPLFPNVGEILRTRNGSKISRFFRHIFEHAKLKKILGTNLAFVVIASSLLPNTNTSLIDASGLQNDQSSVVVTEAPIVIKTEKKVRYPLKSTKINQGYKFYHPGIDFEGITGDEVYPIIPGTVDEVGYSKFGYGNAIVIKHEDNTSSLYAHLSAILVKRGQEVNTTDIIGKVGSTGRSSGDHLHLEIRKEDNTPINPLSVLPKPL